MIRRRGQLRAVRRAFTLIELIATIIVLGIIGGVASGIVFSATDGFVAASTRAQLHAELSIAIDRCVRELRNVAIDEAASGIAPDIDSVSTSSIAWEGDSSLTLSGSNLELAIDGAAAAVLLGDVTAFSVKTYDESNSALATSLTDAACDAIRRVELTATVERYGVSETLRTRIFLRCTSEGAGE